MLRPTPRLPTASVVDDVFAKLDLEDREHESVDEAFDPEGLTEAELIEAHYLGLLEEEATGVDKKGTAIRKSTYVPGGALAAWARRGGLAARATDNQHWAKRFADRLGITVPGLDSAEPQRDYGLQNVSDYSPPKSSAITGDGNKALTYEERVVTRLYTLLEMVDMDTQRFAKMVPTMIIFSTRFGNVTASMMIATLKLMKKLYTQHLEIYKTRVDPARSTRASRAFDAEERVGRAKARGGSYKVKVNGVPQNHTAFEHATRWAAVHPEAWASLDAELKQMGQPGIYADDGSVLPDPE